jgi:hypothetical protein
MRVMPSHEHLIRLARREGPWVTLCMPLQGGGPLAKGDPIRYRNLVRRVTDAMDARAMEADRRAALLGPLERLAQQHDVFNAGARGLVVFVSPDGAEHWHLPVEIEETARVNDRPYLEPLIPLVTDETHFYVVALSQHAVRLLECSRLVCREVPLPPGTPKRLEEAAGWEVRQDSLQTHDMHSGPLLGRNPRKLRMPSGHAGNWPVYHGQGAGGQEDDADLQRFVRDLDQGLWSAITHRGSPVVLASSEALQPVFREHTRLPNVLDAYLHGNFDRVTDDALHARALELLAPRLEQQLEDARARFRALDGTGRATAQIEQVVQAAADGRIDTLFVRQGAAITGRFDPETHGVVLGDHGGTDLLDQAATDTFLSGGTVHRLEGEAMPTTTEAAAILRY